MKTGRLIVICVLILGLLICTGYTDSKFNLEHFKCEAEDRPGLKVSHKGACKSKSNW
ncbi:hypothetical protein CHUAL_013587 [Chamberlinius hualienensis]